MRVVPLGRGAAIISTGVELSDRIAFAFDISTLIFEGTHDGTINHLGVEVSSADEVTDAAARLDAAGLEPTTVTESTCCHADKLETWVDGPDGTHWEWYLKVADVEPTTTEGAAPVSDLQPGHGPPTLPASLLPVAPTPGDGCMLDAADLPARLRQASRLAAHLRGVRRDDLQVVLTVDADGRSDVDDFVRAESQCCAMFDFHVYGTDDRILLAISAPPTSRHLLDELHGVLSDLQRAAPG